MDKLSEVVKEEISWYAGGGRGLHLRVFPMFDDDAQTYGIVAVQHPKKDWPASVMLVARITGDTVVIEEDRTDRPLVDALMHRGIPREKIVLAYLNEKAPDVDYEAMY